MQYFNSFMTKGLYRIETKDWLLYDKDLNRERFQHILQDP